MARSEAGSRRGVAKHSRPDSRYEGEARASGRRYVAGVDEVGRGCLFGPVVAAAVILDPEKQIRGLNDSKKLEPGRREVLAQRIRERAIAVSVAAVDAAWLDRVNVYQASRIAMEQAVLSLSTAADYLLVDAMKLGLTIPQRALIHGDARSRSIAAASIIAKVERDAWMQVWNQAYPGYGLASNKGYGAPEHLEGLRRLGPTPQHRRSFGPVAAAERVAWPQLAASPAEQRDLFAAVASAAD